MGISVANGQTGVIVSADSEGKGEHFRTRIDQQQTDFNPHSQSRFETAAAQIRTTLIKPPTAALDWTDQAHQFKQYREPPRTERLRKKPSPPSSQPSPPDIMEFGEHRERRAWVVTELEKIFRTYGNPLRKGSQEIESHLYEKSRNQDEYLALADKLLRHMRDMATRRGTRPQDSNSESLEDLRTITGPVGSGPPSPAHRSPPPGLTPNPYYNPMDTSEQERSKRDDDDFRSRPVRVGRSASASSEPPYPPPAPFGSPSENEMLSRYDINYGSVRLPAPNKRAFVSVPHRVTYPHRTSSSAPSLRQGPYMQQEDFPEILTRLIREDEGEESGGVLSGETYETSFKFLVPRNAVIKQITIHLKCVR